MLLGWCLGLMKKSKFKYNGQATSNHLSTIYLSFGCLHEKQIMKLFLEPRSAFTLNLNVKCANIHN